MGSKTLSSHFSLISIHEGGIALWRCGAVGELRAILGERERMPSCCCHAERLHSLLHAVRWHDWEQ